MTVLKQDVLSFRLMSIIQMYEASRILVALHRSLWTTEYWKGTINMKLNCGKEKGLLVLQATRLLSQRSYVQKVQKPNIYLDN